jgi:hypothetical protein
MVYHIVYDNNNIFKYSRLNSDIKRKSQFLLVKNANKRKIRTLDVKYGHIT